MAEEYKVLIGAELKSNDLKTIDNKLKSLKNFKVELDINTSSFDNKIKGIENKLKSLKNIKVSPSLQVQNLKNNNKNSISTVTNASKDNISKVEINQAYDKAILLQKYIYKNNETIAKLGNGSKNTRVIENYLNQNKILESELSIVKNENWDNFTSKQKQRFETLSSFHRQKLFDINQNNIKHINENEKQLKIKIRDDYYKQRLANAKELYNIEKKIASLKKQPLKNSDILSKYGDVKNKLETTKGNLEQNAQTNNIKLTAKQEAHLNKVIDIQDARVNEIEKSKLKSFFQPVSFANSMSSMMKMATSFVMARYGGQIISSAFNNVRNVDSAMVELKKVTDESDSTYKSFQRQSGKEAIKVGTTQSDYIRSTADFARLGYTMKEANNLAKTANVYKLVGDGLSGIEEATQSIISTMKAFDIKSKDSMSIVDKVNEVGNRFPISSGGIGKALMKSASSLKSDGNNLDESIALITAGNSVVQNPEVIGTAFKTMSMRIRGAKVELEEAGLETDGMAKSTSKLREQLKALAGVDIMKDDNTFKSTYRILDELSQKWSSLSDINQASIIELIAGKRQGNVMSSIMGNFDIARDALKVSQNSDGSALAEHEKQLDSVEAKLSQVQAKWEVLSNNIINSSFAKGSIDLFGGFISGLDTIQSKIGIINTFIGGFLLKKTGKSLYNKFIDGFGSFVENNAGKIESNKMQFAYFKEAKDKVSNSIKKYFSTISDSYKDGKDSVLNSMKSNSELVENASLGVSKLQNVFTKAKGIGGGLKNVGNQIGGSLKNLVSSLITPMGILGAFGAISSIVSIGMDFAEKAREKELQRRAEVIETSDKKNKSVNDYLKNYSEYITSNNKTAESEHTLRDAIVETAEAIGLKQEEIKKLKTGNLDDAVVKFSKEAAKASDKKVIEEQKNLVDNLTDNSFFTGFKYDKLNINPNKNKKLQKIVNNNIERIKINSGEKESVVSANGNDKLTVGSNGKINLGGFLSYTQLANNGNKQKIISTLLDSLKELKRSKDEAKSQGVSDEDLTGLDDTIVNIEKEIKSYFSAKYEKYRSEYFSNASNKLNRNTLYKFVKAIDKDSSLSDEEKDIYFEELRADTTLKPLGVDNIARTIRENLPVIRSFAKGANKAVKKEIEKIINSNDAEEIQMAYDFVQNFNDNNGNVKAINDFNSVYQKFKNEQKVKNGEISAFRTFLSDENSSFNASINEVQKYNDTLIRLNQEGLTPLNKIEFAKLFPELGNKINDVNSFKKSLSELREEALNTLNENAIKQFKTFGINTESGKAFAEYYKSQLLELQKTFSNFDINKEVQVEDNLFKYAQESNSSKGLSIDSIKDIRNTFKDLKGFNMDTLFDKTAMGVQLNTTALENLHAQYKALKKEDIANSINAINNEQARLIEQLNAETDINKRASLQTIIDANKERIQDIELMAYQYEGLTNAYNQWIMAQQQGSFGDKYDNVTKGLKQADDLYSKGKIGNRAFKSYVQMFTNEDLTNATGKQIAQIYEQKRQLMSKYMTEDYTGTENFLKDIQKLNSSWAETTKDGEWKINVNNDELAKTLDVSKELIDLIFGNAKEYGFEIKTQDSLQSIEELQNKVKETEDKLKSLGAEPIKVNLDFSTVEEGQKSIDEIKKALSEVNSNTTLPEDVKNAQIEDLNNKLDIAIQKRQALATPTSLTIDTSSLDESTKKAFELAEQLHGALNKQEALKLKGLDTSEVDKNIEDLKKKLNGLPTDIKQKINLNIETGDTENTIRSKIAKANFTVNASVKADTSALQSVPTTFPFTQSVLKVDTSDVDNAKKSLESIPKEIKISADVNGKEKIASLSSDIEKAKSKSIVLNTYVNGTKDVNLLQKTIQKIKSKSVTIEAISKGLSSLYLMKNAIDNIRSKVANITANVNGASEVRLLSNKISNLQNKTVYVNSVTNNSTASLPFSRTTLRNARFMFTGTAFKNGSWGTKENGKALGGELGQELVVRGNRYFTIGDNGAEFFKYQKGDIIFNHLQTKEIFEKGKILSRGKAFAGGTTRGSGGFYTPKPGIAPASNKGKKNKGSSVKGNSSGKDDTKKKNDEAKKEFKETVDWVQNALDRLEYYFHSLDLSINDSFDRYSNRISNIASKVNAIHEKASIQERAYKLYMDKANSVGLDQNYINKIRNGQLDIEDMKDENIAKKVKEYSEWYKKAMETKKSLEELKKSEKELFKQKFDFQNKMYGLYMNNVLEHEKNIINENINQLEVSGKLISKAFYEELSNVETEKIERYKKQKQALYNTLLEGMNNGSITKYSQEWYDMVHVIDEITLSIEKSNTQLLQYQKNMREFDFKVFDLIQEKISDVSKESDFLIKLLSNDKLVNDKGDFTSKGKASVGLHAVSYNVNMSQADNYGNEAKRLDSLIAQDKYNQDLIKRRQELIELQRQSILNAEEEKQAIKSLVRDGIEKQIDSLRKLIDKYKDNLDSQKDIFDYQKKISKQTKEISKLEKQLKAYSNDSTEETQAKIQQIKVDLEKAKDELEESEYDKYISDQKKLLDELYNEYQELLNTRLDDIEGIVIDMIQMTNNNATEIKNTISEEVQSVGYTLSDSMQTIWNNASNGTNQIVAYYGNYIGNGIMSVATTVNNALRDINSNIMSMVSTLQAQARQKVAQAKTSSVYFPLKKASNEASSKGQNKSTKQNQNKNAKSLDAQLRSLQNEVDQRENFKVGDKVKFVDGIYHEDSYGNGYKGDQDKGKFVYITSINPNSPYPYHISRVNTIGQDDLGWLTLKQLRRYSTGVKNSPYNELAWTQENNKREYIVRKSDGAILTPINKGDSVLNNKASNNLWNIANNPTAFLKENMSGYKLITQSNSQNVYNQNLGNVTFNLPNVRNYEELLAQMRNDKTFENLLLSMTINKLV